MPPLFARKVTDAEWIVLEGGPEREGSCAVQENWEFGRKRFLREVTPAFHWLWTGR
jgi:hypothetical protein